MGIVGAGRTGVGRRRDRIEVVSLSELEELERLQDTDGDEEYTVNQTRRQWWFRAERGESGKWRGKPTTGCEDE